MPNNENSRGRGERRNQLAANLVLLALKQLEPELSALLVSTSTSAPEDERYRGVHQVPQPWAALESFTEESVDTCVATVNAALAQRPVLFVPPWGRRQPDAPDGRGFDGSDAHEAALAACVPATGNSLLAVFLPDATLTTERSRRFREYLAKRWQPHVLINAQGWLPGVHRSFSASVLFLRTRRIDWSPVHFFSVPSGAPEEEVATDLRSVLARQGGRGRYGYVVREQIPAGDSLAFDRHDPAVHERREDLRDFGSTQSLGELFSLVPAPIRLSRERELLREEPAPGDVRVLGGRDVRADGSIGPPHERTLWTPSAHDVGGQEGDLAVRRMLSPTNIGGIPTAVVRAGDTPFVWDDTAIVLRPREAIPSASMLLITKFLQSPLARRLLRAERSSQHQVIASALLALHVPLPDVALGAALQDLADASAKLEAWHNEASALLNTVFLDKTAGAARARLIASGRSIRQRTEAADLLDDFGHGVRTRYPHPIAYRWRVVESCLSSGDEQRSLDAVLECAEILFAYVAQLGLVMARTAAVDISALSALSSKLKSGRSGPSFGDWVAVLDEICTGRAFRTVEDDAPLAEVRGFLAGEESADFVAARGRLKGRRDDQSHLRRVRGPELTAALAQAVDDLKALLRAAAFLVDLPLFHAVKVTWDSIEGAAQIDYRELMGDHPVVPVRSTHHGANDLEQGSLYVLDAARRWHLLRPYLTGRECPECGNWSTFHIDRAPAGTVELKSLEHGHQIVDPTLRGAFESVGLLG